MKPPQFSLRVIFLVCAAVGLGLGTWRARVTDAVAVAMFFASVIIPALITTAAQCSVGRSRAFWIGALFPASGAAIVLFSHTGMAILHHDGPSFSRFCVEVQIGVAPVDFQIKALWLSIPAIGLLCAIVHWLMS